MPSTPRPGGTLPRTDVFDRLADIADRFALQRDLSGADDWIACERLHDPNSPELAAVLEAERVASGQVSDHATALTMMAVYAGTVTSAAMLAWALEDVVIDMRATNVAVRLSEHHGFEGYGLREATVTPGAPVELLVEQVAAHVLAMPPRGERWVVDVLQEAAAAALIKGAPSIRCIQSAWPPASQMAMLTAQLFFSASCSAAAAIFLTSARVSTFVSLMSSPLRKALIARG